MKKLFVIVLLLAVCVVSVHAWDDTGHKVTAQIAWNQMTPQAREAAIALLVAAPEDSSILALLPTDSRSRAAREQQLFVTMSTWADLVRDNRFPVRKKNYDRPTWHYTNGFFRQVGGTSQIVTELQGPKENVVERLFAMEKVLMDKTAANSERAIALAWILHLAGDVHNPLHTAARVTDVEPEGDRGGNAFSLVPPNTPRERGDNLHSYWDGALSREYPRVNDESDSIYIPKLTEIVVKKHPQQKLAAQLKPGKFDEWAASGFDFAMREVYPATLIRNQTPPETYRRRVAAISEERLALAGYRIAEMLNRVFAG